MKYFIKTMDSILMGVDEAGRGPAIGPLVVASVVLAKDQLLHLQSLGLKDSKLVSKKKREALFYRILDEALFIKVLYSWPEKIDSYVVNNGLNKLECEMMADVIGSCRLNELSVYIDSPEKPEIFSKKLEAILETNHKLNCSFKADLNYPVTAAASIVAKFSRDSIIEELKKEFGDFGSGYPSDKKTKDFVRERFLNPPNIIRKEWKTFKELHGTF